MRPSMAVPVLVIGCLIKFAVTETKYCGLGEYLESNPETGESSCQPCPDGTFMDEPKHTNIECALCRTAEYFLNEIMAEKCTRTKDTVILCTEDHFRQLRGADVQPNCVRCRPCGKFGKTKDLPSVIKPCDDYHDTVCGK